MMPSMKGSKSLRTPGLPVADKVEIERPWNAFENDDGRNLDSFLMTVFSSNLKGTFVGFEAAVAEENSV